MFATGCAAPSVWMYYTVGGQPGHSRCQNLGSRPPGCTRPPDKRRGEASARSPQHERSGVKRTDDLPESRHYEMSYVEALSTSGQPAHTEH